MAKQGRERAVGPYKHGRKFRVFFIAATGARTFEDFESEAEAVKERDAFNQTAGSRTVGEAVREYLEAHASARGNTTTRYRLTAILRLKEGDRPLTAINAPLARQLYTKRTEEAAVDTHRGELAYVSRFCNWCIAQGWIRLNPFADVKPIGEKHSRADEQLRVNEARRFKQTALEEDSLESVVVLMALMLGLRAHEVVERTVRDIDADGSILWVPKSKTRAGVRQLEIPEELRPALLARCEGKKPTDLVFTRDGTRPTPTRHWLHYHVVRIAKAAGVPRVTPHGLRRTWMTMGVLGGGARALAEVAEKGGHADKGVTAKRHYLAPGAIESANTGRVADLLATRVIPDSPLARDSVNEYRTSIIESYETVMQPGSLVTESEETVTSPDNAEVN